MKNNWIVIGVDMVVHCLITSVRNRLYAFLWTKFLYYMLHYFVFSASLVPSCL